MSTGTPFIGPLTRADAAAAEDAANRELVQGVLTLPDGIFHQTINYLLSSRHYSDFGKAIFLEQIRSDADIEEYLRIQELQKTTGMEITISRKPKEDRLFFYRLLHLPGELFAKIIEYLNPQYPADRENSKIVCCMYYGDSFDPKLNCLRYLGSPEFKKHLIRLGFSPHFLDRMQVYLADAGKGSEEDRIAYVVHRVSCLWETLVSEGKIDSNILYVKPNNIELAIDGALQIKKWDDRGAGFIKSKFAQIVKDSKDHLIVFPINNEDLIKSLEAMVSSTGPLLGDSWWSDTFFPWIQMNYERPNFDQLFNRFYLECAHSYPARLDLWSRSLGALPVAQEMGWPLLKEMMLQAVKDNNNSRLIKIIQCISELQTLNDHLMMLGVRAAIQRAIEFDYRECLQTLLLNGGAANNEWHRLILESLLGSNRGYRLQILNQLIPYMKGESYKMAIQWALQYDLMAELDCLLRPENIHRLTAVEEAIGLVKFCTHNGHYGHRGWDQGTIISQVRKLLHAFQNHKGIEVDRIKNFLVDELRNNDNTWWLKDLDIPNEWVNTIVDRIVSAISNKFTNNSLLILKLCNLVNKPEKRELISTETMDKVRKLSSSNSSEPSLEPLRQALKAGEPQSGDRTLS